MIIGTYIADTPPRPLGTTDHCGINSAPHQVVVGICGLCGGQVTIPQMWGGTVDPRPTCQRCHAVEKERPPPTLPVLEMEPRNPA